MAFCKIEIDQNDNELNDIQHDDTKQNYTKQNDIKALCDNAEWQWAQWASAEKAVSRMPISITTQNDSIVQRFICGMSECQYKEYFLGLGWTQYY